MHRIFTEKFLAEIISNQNKVFFFIWIFLIVDLKVHNRVILHFYDEINCKETSLYNENSSSTCFSKFVKKKFNCYIHKECLECSRFIIEDENIFPLDFNNKDERESNKEVFVNTKVIKYNDFLYFFNSIKVNFELKENFQMGDYFLIIHILDIFKFKKNRNFSQIIRTLLLSIVLNVESVNSKYNLNTKTIISSSIYKIIFREFGRIYFFDTSLFVNNQSWSIIEQKLNEKSGINYAITTKFVLINSTFITAIDKYMKYSKNFLIIFRIIFKKLQIFRAILCGSYSSCQNISFHITYILLSNIDELCFFSWENMNFFKFMSDNMIHKNVRILTFIDCYFFSFSEGLFDNFKFLECIYFINSYLANPISSRQINTYLELFVCFYNDITNKKNISNFLEFATNNQHKFENIDTVRFFELNSSLMISQEFKSPKYRVSLLNEMSYMSSCFGLYIDVSNSHFIKRISVIFKDISLRGLIFQNLIICNNIKELSIWNSEFSNDFLNDILLIPTLEKFIISNCKALFEKRLTFRKHSYIKNLSIYESTFENSHEIVNFINSISSSLKILNLCHNKNLYMFQNTSIHNKIELVSLESLVLHDREKSRGDLPNFSGLKIFKKFSLDNGWYEEGSLFQMLINESFADIKNLSLYKFKIGMKDNGAMIRCSKIQKLYFFDCECINTTFSQLFDVKKTYIIKKLVLEKILLTIIDILFISNLFYLKYLQLNIKDFFIETKDFFKVILLHKSQLKIEIKVPKRYQREINYFKEVFQLSNQKIYIF